MKRIIIFTLILFFLTTLSLFSGYGQAYISNYLASGYSYSYLYLTNITDENISVEITIYNSDGTVLLDSGSGVFNNLNFFNYNENPSSGASVSFTIGPKCTGEFSIHLPSGALMGCGIIKYSTNEITPGLIGSMVIVHTNLSTWRSERTITINNGQPF